MDRSIRLSLIIGFIVTLLLIIVVYLFKPLPQNLPNTAKPKKNQSQLKLL